MSFRERFAVTDTLIEHLSPIVNTLTDELIKSNYAGFLSVSAVTVYELAIKDIFIEFATRKNKVLGNFVQKYLDRINGRIKLEQIKDDYVKYFGEKYLNKYNRKLHQKVELFLVSHRKDIRSNYSNLITCRHSYVHEGNVTLSFEEVVSNYELGKEIIESLYEAMQR